MQPKPNAGWYSDPTGRSSNRYWDGERWTDSVNTGGTNSLDPLTPADQLAPPAPATETVSTRITTPPPTVNVTTDTGRSGPSIASIILSVLAVLFVIALLIGIIANDDDDDSTPTDTTETTEEPTETTAPDEGE